MKNSIHMNSPYYKPIRRVREKKQNPAYLRKFEAEWLRDRLRALADNSIRQYMAHLCLFDEWLRRNVTFRNKMNDEWEAVCKKGPAFMVDTHTLKQFFIYLYDQNKSVNTRIAYKRALQDFSHYAVHIGEIESVPSWKGIYIRKTEAEMNQSSAQRLVYVDVKHLREWLASREPTNNRQRLIYARDMALLECLASLGARVNEIVRLKVSDLDFHKGRGIANVFSKKTAQHGARWRVVPISDVPAKVIQDYIASYREIKGQGGMKHLFPPLKDHAATEHITERLVDYLLKSWGEERGIELSAHMFRHYCITQLIHARDKDGALLYNVEEVSLIAGCEVDTILKYYLHSPVSAIIKKHHANGVEL